VHLSNFIFRNTCLLVGLSLEDSTLQHLLRQNALSNPGHIHHMVHFVRNEGSYDRKAYEALFLANFTSYNIYTLFLDGYGIRLLAELISMDKKNFGLELSKEKRKFVYYIIGSIGAGKPTATSNLCNLFTYDEWIDERRPDMAVPEKEVKKQDRRDINNYVAEQFRKKNYSLLKKEDGIHIIDRCPLDPLTFGKPSER
jgi:hypothetical protein